MTYRPVAHFAHSGLPFSSVYFPLAHFVQLVRRQGSPPAMGPPAMGPDVESSTQDHSPAEELLPLHAAGGNACYTDAVARWMRACPCRRRVDLTRALCTPASS